MVFPTRWMTAESVCVLHVFVHKMIEKKRIEKAERKKKRTHNKSHIEWNENFDARIFGVRANYK